MEDLSKTRHLSPQEIKTMREEIKASESLMDETFAKLRPEEVYKTSSCKSDTEMD